MREIAHIRATMLGRFALQQTGMKEPRMVSLAGRSGRLWTLVAYLILHRDRGIPAQELIDLLWPDGSGNNPASTLQNNASRARNAMATLGFSDTKGMIRYENGLYRRGPGTDTWLDVDVFEDLARRARRSSGHWAGRPPICIRGIFCRMRPTSCGVPIFTPTIAPCSCGCSADWCKS